MAGFPFQQTPHTNVTVIAAAVGAFMRSSGTSTVNGSGNGGSSPTMSTAPAALRDIVAERGSSGGDRVSFTLDLAPGDELLLTTSLVSNRDANWTDPMQAAAQHVYGLDKHGVIERLDEQHRLWWAKFWSKSYVHIETNRPMFDQGVHRFYYGALHVLASASRSGKVAPGLYGPFVTCDHMLWGDGAFGVAIIGCSVCSTNIILVHH
jgi:trehalose/maltose hydrolase-like predicted phosphorylase